jgi:hypothetical protein
MLNDAVFVDSNWKIYLNKEKYTIHISKIMEIMIESISNVPEDMDSIAQGYAIKSFQDMFNDEILYEDFETVKQRRLTNFYALQYTFYENFVPAVKALRRYAMIEFFDFGFLKIKRERGMKVAPSFDIYVAWFIYAFIKLREAVPSIHVMHSKKSQEKPLTIKIPPTPEGMDIY